MPIITTEQDETIYVCDICEQKIDADSEEWGVICPSCLRIFCEECSDEYPVEYVKVRAEGPRYKQKKAMCKICKTLWLSSHPPSKQEVLDAYNF